MTSGTGRGESHETGNAGNADEVDEAAGPYRTEQVRIIGAERAADAVAQLASDATSRSDDATRASDATETSGATKATDPSDTGEQPGEGTASRAEDEWGDEEWMLPLEPQLPHWTEAPTGEIPAVLSRGDDTGEEDPWAALPEPTWREERHDWEQEEPLAPSLLGAPGEVTSLITEATEEERQPWSFELGTQSVYRPEDEDTADLHDLGTGDLFEGWKTTEDAGDGELAHSGAGETGKAGGADHLDDLEEPEELEELEQLEQLEQPEDADALAALDARHVADGLGAEEESDSSSEHKVADDNTATLSLPGSQAARPQHANKRDVAAAPGQGAEHVPAGRRPLARRAPAVPRTGDDALSQRTGRNIPAAIASGIIVGGLTLLAFHFGSVPSMVVVTIVLTAAALEAYAAFRREYRPATLLGIVAVAGLLIGTYDKPFVALPVVVVLLVAATFLWHLVGVDRRADPVRSTAATLLVFCWVGVFGSYAALLLAPSLFPHRTGIAYLLGALIAAVAYDVGALAVGAWVGRHPLSAASPGKTWEGVIGGAVAAIVFAVAVVHLVHPWTLAEAAVLGVIVAVVSPVGDLCESLVKRHLGLKDMGRLLPGHGGLLDRVDGLLFVLPATYYLVRAFGHG